MLQLFFGSSETSIILLTVLVLDCSSILVLVSAWFIILYCAFSSSCKCLIWSWNQVFDFETRSLHLDLKITNSLSYKILISLWKLFGFLVYWINISIYAANIWLSNSVIILFFLQRYKADCEAKNRSYPVESSRLILRWHRDFRVWKSYHVINISI